jgi:hypothetical protein
MKKDVKSVTQQGERQEMKGRGSAVYFFLKYFFYTVNETSALNRSVAIFLEDHYFHPE